ncbi:MAG: response regulator [Gracilimonas sp.]|jgi:DNA-binding response OmpR family regulator|uniref:response regulator transcription factor n=1 Tax=Gracilimonas sp. TaxID=1974203 RepID=UPI0037511245|nr:response regulator [Gracilimonas sp.]
MRKNHKILVVEDDDLIRTSLLELLELSEFKTFSAEEGREGLELAKRELPDLIITDIMMPVMNGMEFCRNVFQDNTLAHIPIIMLTARVAETDRIEGLEHGAVDYLTKPYNSKELILKVRNLLKAREQFKKKNWQYLLAISFEDSDLSEDEQLLKSVYEGISKQIDRFDFGVGDLAGQLNLSERSLYRRVKELTGVPVAEFIREIRLQRARSLVENKQVKTISELAYKVGFKSPKHFSRAYKKRFGAFPNPG